MAYSFLNTIGLIEKQFIQLNMKMKGVNKHIHLSHLSIKY